MRHSVSLAFALLLLFSEPVSAVEGGRSVPSPMGGNGHNVSFDGRLFIVRTGPGWEARLLRPERITRDASGFPDVSDAFAPPVLIQTPDDEENALAICETDAASTPYRCDAGGSASAGGAFACYDVWVIDSNAVSGDNRLRRRRLFLQVRNPETRDAAVERFEWRTGLEYLGTALRGIEPTVTRDGRLLVYQGVRENDGDIDTLVYSYNSTPCGATGWSAPRDITQMRSDTRLTGTYRLADSALRAADGTVYTDRVRGAYPWIFPDGEAINFTAVGMPCRATEDPPGCGPRRNAVSVIGYPTNWALAHVDGEVNPSRVDTVRLFFSSPGPRTFAEIPATPGLDVWPFFGSNTSNYTEMIFDDGLDGRYAAVLHMNELVTPSGEFDLSRTPDTSGFFNTGRLVGGASLPPANNGRVGKAVELDGQTGRVEVPHAASLNPVNQLTVEMYVRPSSDPDCDAENNYRYLFGKGPFDTGAYSLVFEQDRSFQARVRAGGVERSIGSARAVPVGAWRHVAFVYDAATGTLAFFVDGEETARAAFAPATLDGSTHAVQIGGAMDTPACAAGHGSFHGAIDEVRISNVARYGDFAPPAGEDAGVPGSDAGPRPGTDGGPRPGVDGGGPGPDDSDGGGGLPGRDSGPGGGDAGASGGCGCTAASRSAAPAWLVAPFVLGIAWRRRRARRSGVLPPKAEAGTPQSTTRR
jgi:MYXO-CTERM domain-containing protein